MIKLSRPPKDLTSFLGRKWLESLILQNQDISSVLELPFILLLADPALPNSRTIAVSSNLTITDAGAGSTITLNLSDTGIAPGTYNSITVDAKGRATAGTVVVAYTDEDAQDAIGDMLDATLVYNDITPSLGINLSNANTWLANQSVPDEVYGITWDGSLEVPTKNAIYDKIESLTTGGGNSVTATLSFGGSFTDKAQTVVTGQTWVAADSEIVPHVLTPSGTDPDEIRLLDFKPVISDLVVGTGFTISLYSEPEATGDYSVMCIGV